MLFCRAFRVKGIESIYPEVVRDIALTRSCLSMDFILFALPMDKGYKRPSRNILAKGMTSLPATFTLPAWMLPAKKLSGITDVAVPSDWP